MNFFVSEVVTPPNYLPITASDTDLAAAVVEEIEMSVLWRAIVLQTRRILIDGPLPKILELEPVSAIVSLTMWSPTDDAAVIGDYSVVTRNLSGTIIAPDPGASWPAPERQVGSFALTYLAGWVVTQESAPGVGDGVNRVPASVRLMIERATAFRAGAGLGDISIGSLKLSVADEYSTDRLPVAITSIGRAYAYRPGIISSRP